MQVFLPDKDLETSAKLLDDKRLNKNITEINQILLIYVNTSGEFSDNSVGHQSHPVTVYYRTREGIKFLIKYCNILCDEFTYRTNKIHMGKFAIESLEKRLLSNIKLFNARKSFKPAYIKGSRYTKDQVITTSYIHRRYRELLISKWNEDDEPSWTKRDIPDFYLNNEQHRSIILIHKENKD